MSDPNTQQDSHWDLNAMVQQIHEIRTMMLQQQQKFDQIRQLVTQGQVTDQDLPIRPRYDWIPDQELYAQVATPSNDIYAQTLTEDQKKAVIELYPPIQGLSYKPPATLEEGVKKFNRGQQREDAQLKQLQYLMSAVLRPLDVLGHHIFIRSPPEVADRCREAFNHTIDANGSNALTSPILSCALYRYMLVKSDELEQISRKTYRE